MKPVEVRWLDAWAWGTRRVRVGCPYNKTPQHRYKRGYRTRLLRILQHMHAGTTIDMEAAWMHQYVTSLQRQIDTYRKENDLMWRITNKDRQTLWDLRDENARVKDENARLRQNLDLRQGVDDYDWLRDRGETVTGD